MIRALYPWLTGTVGLAVGCAAGLGNSWWLLAFVGAGMLVGVWAGRR